MYLHLTQVHSHLRLWSEATDSLTWGSGCPRRTRTCCWRVPFTSQARMDPSHGWLAASAGRPGGSSVLQSAAEHSLDFLIYLFPHFFSSQSTSRWLCAQIARLCLFWWESCIPLYSSSPPAPLLLDHQSHPAAAGADPLTPFLRGQAIPSEQPLPPPSRKSGYRLRFSAQHHPPERLSRLCGLDLSLPLRFVPGELLLQTPPWPASALAVPSIPLPAFTSRPPAQPGGRSLIKSL